MNLKTPPKVDSSSTDALLVDFCEERGLDLALAQEAGLCGVEEVGPYMGMLAIPYQKRDGGVWITRYKTFEETIRYLDEPGANTHLYNPQHLGPHTPEVWFCEGEIDTLILWQLGVPAVGMSGSTKFQSPIFRAAYSQLFNRARIIAATDGDKAGDEAYNDLVDVFGAGVKRLAVPKGMDINDWYLSDRQGLEEAIHELQGQGYDR